MFDRAVAFVDEVKRCAEVKTFGFRRPSIALVAGVIYDMEKARLSVAATFHEKGSNAFNPKIITVNHVIFEVVDEGGEGVRRRLHPSFGSGDIPEVARACVFDGFLDFILMANRHGVAVQSITFGRGLMWMKEDEFQKGGSKKKIEEANDKDGNRIIWMPDMEYSMEDMQGNVMRAMMGGLRVSSIE